MWHRRAAGLRQRRGYRGRPVLGAAAARAGDGVRCVEVDGSGGGGSGVVVGVGGGGGGSVVCEEELTWLGRGLKLELGLGRGLKLELGLGLGRARG